jgi:ABC-type sugar transport system ATPase subunit
VHRVIDGLTHEGSSVIVITSDLDEMMRVVDRVCVFNSGSCLRIHKRLPAEQTRCASSDDRRKRRFQGGNASCHPQCRACLK